MSKVKIELMFFVLSVYSDGTTKSSMLFNRCREAAELAEFLNSQEPFCYHYVLFVAVPK